MKPPHAGNCRECDAPIPPDGPSGQLCPRCLLREGLSASGPTRTGRAGSGRFVAPAPDEIAPHFPGLDLIEFIGQGGMGAVYRARQVKLDRHVALKILAPGAARGASFAERFAREARTLARVSHPNIVAVYDFGESGGLYYLLMEFVDGANLREILAGDKLSPAETLAVIPQICDALQYAHEEGVVHRDIKPENVLLDRRGRVKIADFGLAKLLGQDETNLTLTVPGDMMGTPAYMAPEQIENPSEVDHRADIYSLGVVFYEMLTGELPLGRFDPPSRRARLDVRLDEVVLRSLEKEPRRRYQHAGDVRTDVREIESSPPPAPAVEPAPAPEPRPRADRATPPSAAPPVESASASAAFATRPAAARTPRPTGVVLCALYMFFMALWQLSTSASLSWLPGNRIGHQLVSTPIMRVLFNRPWFFSLTEVIWLVLLAAYVAAGLGLLRLKRWARVLGIVLAALGLVHFPLGTVMAALVMAYLLRKESVGRFSGEGVSATS